MKCLYCGGDAISFKKDKGDYNVFHCSDCDRDFHRKKETNRGEK